MISKLKKRARAYHKSYIVDQTGQNVIGYTIDSLPQTTPQQAVVESELITKTKKRRKKKSIWGS